MFHIPLVTKKSPGKDKNTPLPRFSISALGKMVTLCPLFPKPKLSCCFPVYFFNPYGQEFFREI
jgi:hypothetical protein